MPDTNSSAQGKITREERGHLFLIGIDRPAKLNAFDWPMLTNLATAFTEYEQNRDLRCAVLYAHGDHFTVGLDLANVFPFISKGERYYPEGGIDPWAVHGPARSKPLVVATHGRCMTLGIELALAADIIVAAANTRFSQIEIKRGIFPFGGATIRMVQAAGWGNAMRYLLTGDEFDAAEAYRIGLVQEVVEPGRQLDRALEIAEVVAAQSPLGVQATLASARTAIDAGYDAAVRDLMPKIMELAQTEDAREGLMAMLQKRQANFKGR